MGAPARLIDLSVARPEPEAAALRKPIGTDAYMAPEQCDPPNTGTPGHASDVWGLAATVFEAVAGYRAFDDGDREAVDLAERFPQVSDEPYELPANVPPEVAKVALRSVGQEPRPATAPERVRRGARAGPGAEERREREHSGDARARILERARGREEEERRDVEEVAILDVEPEAEADDDGARLDGEHDRGGDDEPGERGSLLLVRRTHERRDRPAAAEDERHDPERNGRHVHVDERRPERVEREHVALDRRRVAPEQTRAAEQHHGHGERGDAERDDMRAPAAETRLVHRRGGDEHEPSAASCGRASVATRIAASATRSRRGEGSTTARWIASSAQSAAGYAADSVITKPPITVHGRATEKSAEASAAKRESASSRASSHVGIAALAKSTPFRPCTTRTASGRSTSAKTGMRRNG